jgi:hypothetical protein
MADDRWAMGDGRWAMGDGRWAMGDGRWPMGSARTGAEVVTLGGISKDNNVNPGQYKVGGRLRPGEDGRQEQDKERASVTEHELREEARRTQNKKE